MNLVGKTLGNRYEIIEEIGIGGMASVYKARCTLLNRYVAIKVLKDEFSKDAEFVKRFRAEAQSAASLTHPNIVSVYDVGEENGINYIVMELLEGDTLKDYVEKKGRLSNETTLKFASQIASALEAAHKSKIIHRDIKPQNIVLTNNNIAKVTDFGIAKMSSKDTITSNSNTIGSVHYFSPEHAKGCYTDEKSDIYSLGVVMYEMATGVLPFNADTPVSVALKQIQENPVPPMEIVPTITNSLNDIILKAMQKNVADRYQTATQMLDDIFAAINNPTDLYLRKHDNEFKRGYTQAVPIIGLKDDVKPSLSDENLSDVLYSRKASRNRRGLELGKELDKAEEVNEGEDKDKDIIDSLKEKKKLTKKQKIIIGAIAGVIVIILGILTGSLINKLNNNRNKSTLSQVETAPKLIGEVYEEMKTKYKELGLEITVSKYEENAEYEEGKIISQSVNEGEKLTTNVIEVVISKGVKKVAMVDVIGKDYTVAKYEIESLKIVPEFEFIESDKIEANLIIYQAVKGGEEITEGTTVKIQVSKGTGKVMVIVPSVIGDTEANAKTALQNKKLKVSVTYSNDTSKGNGVVISQNVKENAEVEEGSLVEIVVNRLEKSKKVTINLSKYTTGIEEDSIRVKVTAQAEGVTQPIHDTTHQKTENGYENFDVDVHGFSTAKIIIYINGNVADQQTITF